MDKLHKTVLIGTTSINRSLLHIDNIPEWYNYINKLNKKKYDIHWFINIDYIENLDESVQKTKENYKHIIKDISLHFIEKEDQKTGNFLKACKNVSNSIENHVITNKLNTDNVIIIWLEDDWKLNSKCIPLQEIIENYLSNLTYINLSFIRNNYIHALAPSIINYKLWEKIHLSAWKNQVNCIDPEHCVGKYFLNNFEKYAEIMNITVINKYKQPTESFFENNIFKMNKSYYTFDEENKNNIKNNIFIEKNEIKNFIKDQITFIRITTTMCIDGVNYGRDFLKKCNIEKKRIQNNTEIDFYIKK